MPINNDLLIAAPMLQDLLVDKDGTPMAYGTITLFHDKDRTVLKNWYYQSSNFADASGKYTFSTLPNPLTLSAAGTICDINGVDTIPFYYPYSELDESEPDAYYITIVNAAKTNQITRANFPYNPNPGAPLNQEGSVDNYIINNVFWRNIGTFTFNSTNEVIQMVVAPSQHDGFQYPDIQFIKSNFTATDVLTFTQFLPSLTPPLEGDITPEFYINHDCTAPGSGETQKCYQFPISFHIATLSSAAFTVTIQAQNVGGTGTGENVINLFIIQDPGTGVAAPMSNPIVSITLDSAWTKYEINGLFPSNDGITLSTAGNDAFYLQVQMPLNVPCNINFTKPSLYLIPNNPPTNSFQTYDQIDSIINDARTGDIRTSLNQFYPMGWVPMNDGTIGNASSAALTTTAARANIDTWPLYNLLWGLFSPYGATRFPIYTNDNPPVLSTYGMNAYADWNANKALALTRSMGQVMMGNVPPAALLPTSTNLSLMKSVFTASNSGGGLLIATAASIGMEVFYGMPVVFSNTGGALPTGLTANTIYYVTADSSFSSTQFHVASSYSAALAGSAIAFTNSGSGTNTVSIAPQGAGTGEFFHSIVVGSGGSGSLAAGSTINTLPFNIVQSSVLYNMYIKL
jgi:hypothetical protein